MDRKSAEPDEMRSEYDFSGGWQPSRASRFSASEPWYAQAVAADQARWLAEAMLQVQQLEREIVTYYALSHDEDVRAAGRRAIDLVESAARGLDRFAADLSAGADSGQLIERLRRIFNERNWLVHGSHLPDRQQGDDARAARLRRLAGDAERMSGDLARALRHSLVGAAMSETDFERRREDVRRAWPDPRAA